MFNYHMVSKEINLILDQATLAKSAAWDALAHAGKSNEEMCEFRMNDLETCITEMRKQMKEIKTKIEFLKNHGETQS